MADGETSTQMEHAQVRIILKEDSGAPSKNRKLQPTEIAGKDQQDGKRKEAKKDEDDQPAGTLSPAGAREEPKTPRRETPSKKPPSHPPARKEDYQ